VRALAYKWIRIVFRYWKDRLPYVESIHAEALKKRQPAATSELTAVNLQCKKAAGFLKITGVNY
jgi:hypothetical protein